MNPQVLATIRSVLLGAGGFVVGRGLVDESTMTTIVGGVMFALPYAWSLWGHRKDGIIAAASALSEVKTIVTTEAIADSATFKNDPTVVSAGDAPRPEGGRYR